VVRNEVDPDVEYHCDVVTETGADLAVIASANHARVYGTRHRDAPAWTVQFHPELTTAHREQPVEGFDWESGEHSFDGVDAGRVSENFVGFAGERT